MKYKPIDIMRQVVLIIVILITVLLLASQLFFMYSKVPSGSMEPTIHEGEYILIKRTSNIQRGDVAAFYSDEFKTYMLKRCIGVPGDVVDIREGNVYLNGVYLQEDYVVARSGESQTFIVPEDSYFFLGDNRANSFDAREWSTPFIAKEDVIGKMYMEIYPVLKIWK